MERPVLRAPNFLAQKPEAMRSFDRLGYRFCPEESDEDTYTFIKEDAR